MYCLMTSSGTPPTVETKYELVHNDGSRERKTGNSSRSILDERPLIRRISR